MAAGVGDLLDGWANRDIDIDAFGSAVAQHFVPWAQSQDKFTQRSRAPVAILTTEAPSQRWEGASLSGRGPPPTSRPRGGRCP